MKNILKISLTAFASAALLFSCIKEVEPTDRTTKEQVTLETMVKGIPAAMVKVNSLGYAALYGSGWDFSLPAIHVALESMTGDMVVLGNTGYDHFSAWGTNNALGSQYASITLTWENYYTWIMTANDVIGMIDEASVSASEKAYLGYAYAYRAMCYLDLTRIYEFKENNYTSAPDLVGKSVPIVLETTSEAEAKNNPRASTDDVYEKVIFPDLEKAETLLSDRTASSKYEISLALVYGLKARAYLERGTAKNDAQAYAKAAEYARKAITESGCTPLTQDQWEDPKTGFNDATANNSWIWGLALPSESVANLFNFTAHMSGEESWGYAHLVMHGINKALYNSISDKDFRKHSWLDPDRKFYDYKTCRPAEDKYFSKTLKDYASIKFRPAQGAYSDYKTGGAADHCCMRVEEMYLIEAEATAHSNLSQAVNLLNTFMKTRITDGSYDCSSKATSVDRFVDELMLQKRIELWGEGVVFFDLKRLGMSVKRGYVGTNAPSSYRLNCDGLAPYWNMVITRGETQNNPAVVNNPDPSGKVPLWVE